MKRRNKTKHSNKILTLLFIILLIIGVSFSIKFALFGEKINKEELHSKNFYVYNITDDKVELNINEKDRVPPASLTKIMTVWISLKNIEDLNEIAPVDVASYLEMISRNSSMAGFFGKETTTFRDLLYGTMLASGGEAAHSLAINISGNKEDFVKLMNEEANLLELSNTQFKNPDGLDEEGHYSSAEDLAKLLNHALQNGHFRAILTKAKYRTTSTLDHPDGIEIDSTVLSKLPMYEQTGFKIIGGKSGTTIKAGHCWATLVEKNEKEYICIVMGSPYGEDLDGHILDTLYLMDYIN